VKRFRNWKFSDTSRNLSGSPSFKLLENMIEDFFFFENTKSKSNFFSSHTSNSIVFKFLIHPFSFILSESSTLRKNMILTLWEKYKFRVMNSKLWKSGPFDKSGKLPQKKMENTIIFFFWISQILSDFMWYFFAFGLMSDEETSEIFLERKVLQIFFFKVFLLKTFFKNFFLIFI